MRERTGWLTPARWVAAVGVAVAALASTAGGSASGSPSAASTATFATQSSTVKGLTVAIQMTKDDPSPTRSFTGPTDMLVDPTNPRIIVAASADLRTRVCYLLRSADAGKTWHIVGPNLPALKGYPSCTTAVNAGATQASIAWGRNQTLYYALGGYGPGEGGNNGDSSVLLARSTDLGNTWSTVLVDNNRGKTGPDAASDSGVTGLAVDTSGPQDVVYVGWMVSYPNAPMTSDLNNGAVDVAVSTNGGTSFGSPVNINTFSHLTTNVMGQTIPLFMQNYFAGPFLVAHNGVVMAVSGAQTSYTANIFGTGSVALPQIMARSVDHGKTWAFSTLGVPILSGTGNQTGMGWTPLGGPNGTFLATYASTPADSASSGTADIAVQRSSDNGQTWTDPVVINDDDPSQQFTSFYPQLDVAPDGRVDVVWEDNRDQYSDHFQVYYSYSGNAGVTWAHNVMVSDLPINFGLGVSYNSDIRQPPGVASANQYAAFGWADTRLGNGNTQTQDDFGDAAQFAPLPARGSKVLPILAAIFGGLAVAGVIFLVLIGMGRRRVQATT